MAVGTNNIYPPVVSSYAPNFIIGDGRGCRVYFSISAYNSMSEYADVHITITNQSNNISALNTELYPSFIKIIKAEINSGQTPREDRINIDNTRTSADKYYIWITNDDIQDGFQVGTVYKVQMRFSSIAYGTYPVHGGIDDWLREHLSAFSEWSQVCLAQGINQPEVAIKNGSGGVLSTSNNYWYSDTLEIVGSVTTDDTDPLRQYQLILLKGQNEIYEDSGILFPPYQSYANQINYIFKRALQDGEEYILQFKYMTAGLYQETIEYPLLSIQNLIEPLDAYITSIEDVENARIGLHIQSNSIAPFAGKITIRRTSSKSNFELWEDVHTIELRAKKLEYLWYDYTVESGIWYKYCIQKRNVAGNRGIITMLPDPVMIIFDHMYLAADNNQLKIKFNPQISSFKIQVNDTKIDTIGNKYPVIKRNGATYYRTFPISGLISFLSDENKLFMDRTEYYGEEITELYNKYNEAPENQINIFNDIQYERDFREKVEEFLNKHNVKLFRSATEGNILVKLMDVNFTPNETLGRRIYTFSCTAYEIDDCSLNNLDKYNIQPIEDPSNTGEIISYETSYEGQWDNIIPAGAELIHLNPAEGQYSILEEYYKKLEQEQYILSVDHLDFLRIEIYDEPYLIYESATGPRPYDELTEPAPEVAAAAYLGYIAYINGKTIIIPSDGIYEIRGDNTIQINSLSFEKDTNAEIRYHVVINQSEDISKILSLTTYTNRIGQEWGGFIPGERLYKKLWNKYYMEHPTEYYQALVSINGIRVEANPGTIVYVQEEEEDTADRHLIGSTASLDFYDPDSVIKDVYFTGVHFEPATEYEKDRDELPEGKFVMTDIIVDSLDKIENPKDRYVYYLQSNINTNISAIGANVASGADSPELATLITAKGLPIFYVNKNNIPIAIVAEDDLQELQDYLTSQEYTIYVTDNITFSDNEQIKIAYALDNSSQVFEFILDNIDNKNKLAAYQILLNQYGLNQLTAAVKRQLWKDVVYNISEYYIYYNKHWYVFDENTYDALCPVPASIDYICETMKGYYKTE